MTWRRSRSYALRVARAAIDRGERRAPTTPRPSGTSASSGPLAQSRDALQVPQVEADDRRRADGQHDAARAPAPATAPQAPPAPPRGRRDQSLPDDAASASASRRVSAAAGRRPAAADEPVAAAANRFDQSVRAERLERDAQAADVHVDRALLDVDVIAPHQVEQLRAACARARDAPCRNAAAGIRSGPSATVVPPTRDAMRDAGRASARRPRAVPAPPPARLPAQHRLDARLQLARRERLRHVVVDPGFEARDLVRLRRCAPSP